MRSFSKHVVLKQIYAGVYWSQESILVADLKVPLYMFAKLKKTGVKTK
jgi:hypothetical protein